MVWNPYDAVVSENDIPILQLNKFTKVKCLIDRGFGRRARSILKWATLELRQQTAFKNELVHTSLPLPLAPSTPNMRP